MSGSNYIKALRASIGDSLLLLPGVAAVIHNSSKEILLQEKSEEIWSLPAGMIEPGESPKEAIVREVQEETGLVIVPSKILGVFGGTEFRYVYPNGDQVEYTVIVFKCEVKKDVGYISDSETKSIKYFEKNHMPNLALPYPKGVLFDELSQPYM